MENSSDSLDCCGPQGYVHHDASVLAGAVSQRWLSRPMSHADIVSSAADHVPPQGSSRRVTRALHTVPHSVGTPQAGFTPWPRRTSDPRCPAPPVVTDELVRAVERQDHAADPDAPYPPALAAFVSDLEAWHRQLLQHFVMSQRCYALNSTCVHARMLNRHP